MAQERVTARLYDPRRGDLAISIDRFEPGRRPFEPLRTNCFSVYLIETGSGVFWADAARHEFGPGQLLFFVPYQHIRFSPALTICGGRAVSRQLLVRRDISRGSRLQRNFVQRSLRDADGRIGRAGPVGRESDL